MGAKTAAILASLVCGLSVATEVFAYQARLAPALGMPLYKAGILAFYGPWMIVLWAWWWLGSIPRAFALPILAGAGLAILTLVQLWPRGAPRSDQARWATEQDLAQAECRSDRGIVVGKLP